MRLVNGAQADPSSGRLQLYIDNSWVDVVQERSVDGFDNIAAAVVCKSLGWIGDVPWWDLDPTVKQQGPCVVTTRPYRWDCNGEAADLLACNSFQRRQCDDPLSFYPVIVTCADSKGAWTG